MDQEAMVTDAKPSASRSQERILDAEAIEEVALTMTRPTARMHLEALAKKLRKEGEALQRVEKSEQSMEVDENKEPPNQTLSSPESVEKESIITSASTSITRPPVVATFTKYIPVDTFSFDAGGYNAPFVTVYVALTGVGSISRDLITCEFKPSSFDLIIKDLNGKSYRLFQDHLEKDIDPTQSKIIVKPNKIIIKLAKVKQGDYGGYDYWTKLSDKKAREKEKKIKDDPQSSIMDLMKQMYEDGDDNMKKIIGETMMKQQRGELSKDDPMKGLDKMDF